jgi:hypothetical protein
LRPEDIEVCLKAPAKDADVVIAADVAAFTKVWLGYVGLRAAVESGKISLQGSPPAITTVRRLLALPDEPTFKSFRFSSFQSSRGVAAQL